MSRFLITGSAGFIGYHLALRLLEGGHDVVGVDGMTAYYDVSLKRRRNARLLRFPRYRFVQGMIEAPDTLRAALDAGKPDIIVHLAAQAGVRYSIEAPRTYVDSNITGSWAMLELARQVQPLHLLMASTSSVYGANPDVPFGELDRADEPLSIYAATKKSMEVMSHSYAHLFAVPITVFRFFTVYGPWGRPDMALFKFVAAILNGHPIDVYGYGRMSRDFTYVDDLVEAVIRLVPIAPAERNRVAGPVLDSLSRQAPYRVVNIGGGHPTPLMDFIRTVEQCVGHEAILNLVDMQPGDVPRTYADPRLLEALTGYLPQTAREVGVARFVEWYLDDRLRAHPSAAAGRRPLEQATPQNIARPQL